MADSLLSEIMTLKALSAKELQQKYAELFNGERPASTYKVYLWRQIAYRMQEAVYGGLSQEAQGRIKELIQEYDPVNNKALRPEKSPEEKKQSTRDRRLPIPGTFLVKEYKGKAVQVKVLEKGFEYVQFFSNETKSGFFLNHFPVSSAGSPAGPTSTAASFEASAA